MAVKTIHTKPKKYSFYIVDYIRLDKPVLLRYEFKNKDLADRAIVNNLGNDTLRYNIISGKDARKHGLRFQGRGRNDAGRIWPDRKYDYPPGESLTPAQKKNFRNKQNQRAYLERKKQKHEHSTEENPSYIDSNPRWRNLRHSRRLRRRRASKLATK